MEKLHFASDYMEGAHPAVLAALCETNAVSTPGYGTDLYCSQAAALIREACGCPGAAVYFLSGGTQTNETVLSALLRPWEGVIAADTGHISAHEAGAVERGGHKVLTIPHRDGKISAGDVAGCASRFYSDDNHDHMVFPGAVYISQPTEYGTVYSLGELEELSQTCRKLGLRLYCDGARLAYALGCPSCGVSLADLARLCDVFYIGGTKCGALLGEAVVARDPSLLPHFFTVIKQHGALLAKGRVLGVQFKALFENGLYEEIGKRAVSLADRLRAAFSSAGYTLLYGSPTNQLFVSLDEEEYRRLSEAIDMSFWERDGGRVTVRLAVGWAAEESGVAAAEKIIAPACV